MRLPADTVARLREFFEDRHLCVTGGAGFIGGHLVDTLLSLGATIAVIDDLSNSTPEHLADLIDLEPDRVRFIHGSILDDRALSDAIDGASAVFHLAAIGSVPRSIEEPARSWIVNATGTLRVLEAARAAGAERVIYSASSSAYGDGEQLPRVESQAPDPLSPYAASKLAGESLIRAWASSFELGGISLRYFNIFGPRQPGDSAYSAVVAAFMSKYAVREAPVIHGDGEQTRDFTYVSNAVLANLLAASTPDPLAGEVVNVGSGRMVSVLELASLIAERMDVSQIRPVHKPERTGDVRHSLADLTRAKALLGYEPVASIEEGLDETISWFVGPAANSSG